MLGDNRVENILSCLPSSETFCLSNILTLLAVSLSISCSLFVLCCRAGLKPFVGMLVCCTDVVHSSEQVKLIHNEIAWFDGIAFCGHGLACACAEQH